MAGDQAAVTVRGVYRTFDRDTAPVRVLRGCELTIALGELVAVVGPSGEHATAQCGDIFALEVTTPGMPAIPFRPPFPLSEETDGRDR